jgi:hypothetical protein
MRAVIGHRVIRYSEDELSIHSRCGVTSVLLSGPKNSQHFLEDLSDSLVKCRNDPSDESHHEHQQAESHAHREYSAQPAHLAYRGVVEAVPTRATLAEGLLYKVSTSWAGNCMAHATCSLSAFIGFRGGLIPKHRRVSEIAKIVSTSAQGASLQRAYLNIGA